MKAKRILSVILAVAMMISLLPAISFSASAEDPIELQYIFNQVAGGASGKNALSAVTYDTITQGNKWTYGSYYKMASQALDAGGLRFVPTTNLATEKNNGMAIKIDVPEGVSGTFLPTITCAQMESGGIVNVYLISGADATAKGWDMHTSSSSYKTSAVYQTIADSLKAEGAVANKIIDGIDTYNGDVPQTLADKDYSATVTKSGAPIELSTGTYYLVFAVVGANANAKVYSDTVNSYYARICNIAFRQAGDAEVTVTADNKEIAVGKTANISASAVDGFGVPVNAEFSFESSNENVATIDANGVVTGVAEGKATITATATVGGATVNGTVEINVYSTSAKDEDYYFCYQALGLSANLGMSDNESNKDAYTYDDIVTTVSPSKWDYLMVRNVLAGAFRAGYTSVAVKEANMNLNSVASFKIKVTGTSAYIPSFTYCPYQSGAKVNVYLLSEEARAAKGWDMSGKTSGLASFLTAVAAGDSDIKLLGTSDTYSTATSAKANVTATDTYAPIRLSGGDYYLLFVMNGKNDNAVVVENSNGPHYYFWPKNFSLTQMGDIAVDAVAENSSIAIGATTNVSAKVEAAGSEIAGATVTYKSSNDAIATVDANGVVTAIAEGKVTITATATVAGNTASDSVEIEVISTEPRDEQYVFSREALGLTANLGMSDNESNKDAYTYDNIVATVSPSKWDYLMVRNTIAGAFRAGIASVAVKDENKNLNSVASFKIKVNGGATYIPSLTYAPYQSGAKVNVYLVDSATAEKNEWDMSGKTSGLASVLSAINSNSADVRFIGTADTYASGTSTNGSKTDAFAPISVSGGEHYLIFVMNGVNENAVAVENNNGPHYYYWIRNFKLTKMGNVTLSVTAENDVIEIGGETTVSATLRDESGADVKGVEVSYASSDADVATVDNKGVVTAKAVGKATITASAIVAGVPLSDSVEIEVEAEDLGNAGVELEYFFDTRAMSAEARAAAQAKEAEVKNGGLDAKGNLRDMSFIGKLSDIDATKSAQFAWTGADSYAPNGFVMSAPGLNVTATKGFYGDSRRQFLAFKVNIPNKGLYNFSVRANGADFGAGADVHLVPAKGIEKITREMLDARTPVGHFETKGSGDLGYIKVGKFSAEKRGEYYVVFDFNTDNEVTYQSKGKHYFYGQSMKIAAAPGDFDKIEMSLRGIEEGEPIAVKSVRDINIVLTDKAGMPLDEIDESKLSIEITSDNEETAVITEDGKLDAVACGTAKITAKVTYDGVKREASVDALVTPVGKEIMGAAQNPDLESDVWPWDMARQNETPSSPWWIRAVHTTAEKDGNADNRAMGVVINPEIAASDVYGINASNGKYNNPPGPAYIRAADGPRMKVKTGQFYLFTFKMKLENWTTPSGAEPMGINLDLYPYSGPNAGTSTAGYNRGMNIVLEPNWTEKYQEWQTVTVPVSAEFLTGRDEEYFTPVFVFRPSQTDIMKAGYGGTAWFDDFSLREVGFDDLEVTVEGETTLGQNSTIMINVRPRTATGHYISLDANCVPKCVDIKADNSYIIGEIMKPERTAMVDMPGIYYASAASSLAGMNGTANISATMTLNGVTRGGNIDVTASNFERKIMYAEATAEALPVGEGNTTQINVAAYDTNGEAIDLANAQILYKAKSKDILSVDENGVVSPLAAGTGYVDITVIYENVTVVTVAEIHVTDGTPIVSAELTGASELGFLRDLPLTIRGMSESGYAADIEAADIEWVVSGDAVSVNEDGYMFGNIEGETVEIYANVTLNGATVKTNTITVTVVKSDLRSFKLDFAAPKTSVADEIKLEEDGWEFDFANTSSQTRPGLMNTGFQTQNNNSGQVVTIKFNAPYAGYYMPVFRGRCIGQKAADDVDFYIDGTYIGNYSFYFMGITAWGETETMRTIYLGAGTHELRLRTNPNSENTTSYQMGIREMYFIARDELPQITDVSANELTVEVGETKNLNAVMNTADDFSYAWQTKFDGTPDAMASVAYALSDQGIAEVDANGNIKGIAVGETEVTATARTQNSEKANTYKITVIEATSAEDDRAIASAEIEYDMLVMSTNSDGIELSAIAKNSSGDVLSLDNATITWSSSDEAVATVDGGKVTPISEGIADITAEITIGDDTKTATVTVSVRGGKTTRTYYTDSRVEAARENIGKYRWAKSTKDAAVRKADRYADLGYEYLWKMIPGNSIPRTWQVGLTGDPEIYLCRYCGVDVQTKHSVYPWIADAISKPWKIQCPECKRLFPSNDFAKLYELGIDENTGVYDVALAHERNAALVEETDGKVDYLKNTLYPEVGTDACPVKLTSTEKPETWGVDDGLGYDTGSYYSNGKKRVYTFIPYYHHYGIWYSSDASKHSATVKDAIISLSDAYIYTGDEKYGRAGAIMLDRMADLYPEFCTTEGIAAGYYLGSSKNGKMVNNIWQSINDLSLSKTYDSFFPIYDDPQVVSFLGAKAKQYPGIGDKSTAEAIRTNIETNYLAEMYTAALEADLRGNFGHHQSAIAAAAIVLDTQPITNQMLDWIFKESIQVAYESNSGGGVGQQLINEVSRDGQGTESAPGYNRIWVTQLYDVAEILSMNTTYDGMDLWGNPKYIGMVKSYNPMTMVRRGQPSIGDSGRTGWFAQLPDDQDVIIGAFNGVKKHHKESAIGIAQLLYRLRMYTEGNLDGMHYDIFTKNPESIKQEILNIIEEHGEYPFDRSSMMTGYGLGVLRAGTLYEDTGTTAIRDTTRDFWMYFGGATSHSHYDKLNLGIEAYGLAMTPENGYPEQTGYHPNRHQWTNTTISHNAVVVDEKSQYQSAEPLDPLHFDAKDTRVKVMDIDGSRVYTQTEEYRRTVVMVDYDKEISYGVDFFKILGGDDHLYSFHASGEDVAESSPELNFEKQIGGTYAGVDVPFGNDPYTDPSTNYKKLKYPDGYTWLEHVERSQTPNLKNFYIDFDIIDLHNYARNPKNVMDINLRVTMANDFEADEVTLADGYPPRNVANLAYAKHQKYMLVRRTGSDLNTLFTTVYEPYNKERYIKNIERVGMEVKEGTPKATDKAAAVKVELVDGRTDYIVYAQNGNVTYTVTDGDMSFDFKGFVGVWTVNEEGENIYSYIHDTEILSDITDARATVNGTITDFTHELAFENFIEVSFDEKFEDAEALSGALFRADSPAAGNAAYVIEDAVIAEDGMSATLNIGYPTFIDSYKDSSDINGGYNYDIAEGQTFSIALTYEDRHEPVFDELPEDISTSAGSSISIRVNATADDESEITYSERTLPRGASFDAETGTVTWKPTGSQIGDNLFAIDATDAMGRTSTIYFTVKVYGSTTGGGGGGGGGATAPSTPSTPTIPTTPGVEKPEDKPTTPTVPTTPTTPDVDSNVRFIDLGNYGWAADAINSLADDGIIKGTSENTFSPAANITRADFAVLLVRAFKLASENSENFADVSSSDYFAKELAVARNTGLINGIGENKFAPRNNITRQDMMVIVYRALAGMKKLNVGDGVLDVPQASDFDTVSDYAKEAVSALVNAKLVNGKNGLIAPKDNTTRAEIAVLLKRILDYIK